MAGPVRVGAVLLVFSVAAACVSVPVSRRATARRDAYLLAHRELRPDLANAIAGGHVVEGMDHEQVEAVLGAPLKRSTFRSSERTTEVWVYAAALLHQGVLREHGGTLYRLVLVNNRLVVIEAF